MSEKSSDSFLGIVKEGIVDAWKSTDPKNRPDTHGDLNKFIQQVKRHGLARPSKFLTTFSTPRCLMTPERQDALGRKQYGELLAMMCSEITLPGVSYDTMRVNTFGHFEVPYDKIYSPVQATFYLDAAMELRSFYDQWIDSIQLHTTKGFEFYQNFVCDIDIFVLNEEDKRVYHVKLIEAYPKLIYPTTMNYSQPGIMTMQVEFMYKNYITQPLPVEKEQFDGFLEKLDKYFGQFQFYKDAKSVLGGIGKIVTTADELLTRGEIIKGRISGLENIAKGIPGIFKAKNARIKDLGLWS